MERFSGDQLRALYIYFHLEIEKSNASAFIAYNLAQVCVHIYTYKCYVEVLNDREDISSNSLLSSTNRTVNVKGRNGYEPAEIRPNSIRQFASFEMQITRLLEDQGGGFPFENNAFKTVRRSRRDVDNDYSDPREKREWKSMYL